VQKAYFLSRKPAHLFFSEFANRLTLWQVECLNIVSRFEINCGVCRTDSVLGGLVCASSQPLYGSEEALSRSQLALLKGRKTTLTSFCPVK